MPGRTTTWSSRSPTRNCSLALRALGRRPPSRKTSALKAGPIELDETTRRVTIGGKPIDLSQREFSILECLLRRPGQVLSRDQLLDYAWPYGVALASLLAGYLYAGRALVPIRQSIDRRQAALQRQREFAANASHELRTPLTVIGASVEDLKRNRRSKVEDVGEALGDIEAEVRHMTALVEDMLLLARTDSGVVQIERVRWTWATSPPTPRRCSRRWARNAASRSCWIRCRRPWSATPAPPPARDDPGRQRHPAQPGRLHGRGPGPAGRRSRLCSRWTTRARHQAGGPAALFERFWRADDAPGRRHRPGPGDRQMDRGAARRPIGAVNRPGGRSQLPRLAAQATIPQGRGDGRPMARCSAAVRRLAVGRPRCREPLRKRARRRPSPAAAGLGDRPTQMIVSRSAGAGSLRPTLAPTWPPTIDPAAISSATSQWTGATAMNRIPATPLIRAASTFLRPLRRWMSSGTKIVSRAIMMIPMPAPK
jgi:hypothetical protein